MIVELCKFKTYSTFMISLKISKFRIFLRNYVRHWHAICSTLVNVQTHIRTDTHTHHLISTYGKPSQLSWKMTSHPNPRPPISTELDRRHKSACSCCNLPVGSHHSPGQSHDDQFITCRRAQLSSRDTPPNFIR